jgi:hypothetical protein
MEVSPDSGEEGATGYPGKLSPKKVSAVETAIRHAAYILGEIDKKWPSKAPFAHRAVLPSNTTPVI